MDALIETIMEQYNEYDAKLKIVEKEIVRKYKNNEDYSEDVIDAKDIKMMKTECILMMNRQIISKLKTNR